MIRGVSGSDKSNETDDPNQSKPEKKNEFFGSDKKPNRTNENRSGLVRFSVQLLKTDAEPNRYLIYNQF
jgi:hypothetical protein